MFIWQEFLPSRREENLEQKIGTWMKKFIPSAKTSNVMDFAQCWCLNPSFLDSKVNFESLRKIVENRFLLLSKGTVLEFKRTCSLSK
jgi:hypothetical protein